MTISLLTGFNPFYVSNIEENTFDIPDYILERFELLENSEGSPLDKSDLDKEGPHHYDGKTYHHVTVSKHISDDPDHHKLTHAIKSFADHVEKHSAENMKKHGQRQHPESDRKTEEHLHHSLNHEHGMNSKPTESNKATSYKGQHTHAYSNEGGPEHDHSKNVTKHEPSHKEGMKQGGSSKTAEHMIHWKRHAKTGKIHIIGTSRHHRDGVRDMNPTIQRHKKQGNVTEDKK